MDDTYSVLLITNEDDIKEQVLKKLVLSRCKDRVYTTDYKNYKNILARNIFPVAIVHCNLEEKENLKIIKKIKEIQKDICILVLLNNFSTEQILSAYDYGANDYLLFESDNIDYAIKTLNCIKLYNLNSSINFANNIFVENSIIDEKTHFYKIKYLKEFFNIFYENYDLQNSIFTVLSLDDSIKTKISSNRLAQTIQNCTRNEDIKIVYRGGKFGLILKNQNKNGLISVLNKIQDNMGQNYKIHAGYSIIYDEEFEKTEKLANDSLISAIQKQTQYENISIQQTDNWLEVDETSHKKVFKLFTKVFKNKLENIITPIFYRYEKEFKTIMTNTNITQYCNEIESVFCIKKENNHSELVIRYDNNAKFLIEIVHNGLDSAENTKLEMPIKDLTEKSLTNLLKQLKKEFRERI